MATQIKSVRERITYFHALKNEGFGSHEAHAIAKDEQELSKGDKAGYSAFYAVFPDHEFRDVDAAA